MRPVFMAMIPVLALGAASGSAGDPAWSRISTPRFAISAELPGDRTAQVARRLEAFRSAIEEVLPPAPAQPLQPTFVVVFANEASFAQFRPRQEAAAGAGRATAIVTLDPTAPSMAFHVGRGEESYRAVLREYARLLLASRVPGIPLWFMEGAADYYATLSASEDGRLRLGEPDALNVLLLGKRPVPVTQILSSRQAPAGPGAEVFYAQSWALAHRLLSDESLRRQVPKFLSRVSAGGPPTEAFEEAFGPVDAVEKGVCESVGNKSYPAREVLAPRVPAASPMSGASLDAALGRLLLQVRRHEEAEARLRRALASDPSLVEAHLALGLLRMSLGRFAEALEPLRQARALAPGDLAVAYSLATATLRIAEQLEDDEVEEARSGLAKLLSPETRVAEAWAVLGALSGRLGMLDEADRALRHALELAPARLQTVLELVDVCVARGALDEAGKLLDSIEGRAMGTGNDLSPWRERVAREREASRIRADLAKAAGTAPPAGPPDQGAARTGRWIVPPDYRETKAGEERAHGLLKRIECGPAGLVVEVVTADGTLRLAARSALDVEAISYREGFEPSMSCGVRRGLEPVLVTWRPATGRGGTAGNGVSGTAVAVEFLGEEYLPGR